MQAVSEKFIHELDELTEETPIATAIHSIVQQCFGWPTYLFANITGHNFHERQPEGRGKGKTNGLFTGVNHFNPGSPLYEAKDAKLILLSDVGLAITVSVLCYLSKTYGFSNMLVWYFIPYLWVNHWLGIFPEIEPLIMSNPLTPHSCHHLPAAHRPNPSPLRTWKLELRPWCRRNHRSRIRLHWPHPPARYR